MSVFEGPDVIVFDVPGLPRTQGSVRAILPKNSKKPIVVQGSSATARKALGSWRSDVAAEARRWRLHRPFELLTCPVRVRLIFTLSRPASAPKTIRTWPIGKQSGDLDKLARSVFDALTGVIWKDDSQVIGLVTAKDYGPNPGVVVSIAPVVR